MSSPNRVRGERDWAPGKGESFVHWNQSLRLIITFVWKYIHIGLSDKK